MRFLRWVVRAGFWLVAAGFFALFILEFARSAALDSSVLVIQLRRLGNPIVRQIGSLLGISAGSGLGKYLPLVIVLATLAVQVAVDTVLLKISIAMALASKPKRRAPAQPPAPVAQLAQPEPLPPPPAPRATVAPRPPAQASQVRVQPAPPSAGPSSTPMGPQPAVPSRVVEEPVRSGVGLNGTSAGLATVVGVPEIVAGMPNRVGRYELLEELGRGAMGAVYKARDPNLGRAVAVKVILTANLTAQALAEYKKRFYREAEAAGRMTHPGVVTIHDMGEDSTTGQPFLVMEYVEGVSLDSMIEGSPGGNGLPLAQVLEIGAQVALALDYAHQRGVVHRDIKPANILVTKDGRAKIADFGIAKLEGAQLTQTGQLVGTPAYMSPEQFSGGGVDARSDIFSLGAVLYEALTGKMPFPGETVTEIIFKVVQAPPVPAQKLNPQLPAEVDVLLERCLAKDPAQRYQRARALATDLENLKVGRPLTPLA
ncbi:MAG TPA: serine/threonine-protein kinase [Candidatus Xenobia bacterium]|nr:serine/threonine-protein kinase [Candidatus Xenobia bacterium]